MNSKTIPFLFVYFVFISCSKKTEIIQLSNTTEYYSNGKAEYFVISNPPNNRDNLLNLVSRHFNSFAPNDTIAKRYYYNHFYFRETWFTPRNYKKEFDNNHHYKDLLIIINIQPNINKQTIYFYQKGDIEQQIETVWKEEKYEQ